MSISNIVYQKLKEEIIYMELIPGQNISEIEISKQFNVSRTPVRDAFKRLENEKLLEIKSHVGTFIALIDLNQVSDILYMRQILEYSILSDLVNSITQSQLLKLRIILEKQKSLVENDSSLTIAKDFILIDNEFHMTLFEFSGKGNIWFFLTNLNYQYERFRMFLNLTQKNSLYELYNEHMEILELVANKDILKIKEVLFNHIYGGFKKSSEAIYKNSAYFKEINFI